MNEFMSRADAARACFVAIGIGMVAISSVHAQEATDKVDSKIIAYTITVDENGKELRERADVVSPGGIIEYEMTYRNISEEPLGNFIIQGQVPETTYYHSAKSLETSLAVFEVSVADIGWASPPVTRYVDNGTGALSPVEVPEEEYQALRWRLVEPITPGEVVSATYRIKVED